MWGAFSTLISSLIYTKWIGIIPEDGSQHRICMYGYTFSCSSTCGLQPGHRLFIYNRYRTPGEFQHAVPEPGHERFGPGGIFRSNFNDYVYTRYCTAALKGEWFRDRRPPVYRICHYDDDNGFLHGLSLRYVMYGFYHGVLRYKPDLDTRWKGSKPSRQVFIDCPCRRHLSPFQLLCRLIFPKAFG